MVRRVLNVLVICCVIVCDDVPILARMFSPDIVLATSTSGDNLETGNTETVDLSDGDMIPGDDSSQEQSLPDDEHPPITTNPEQDSDAEEEANRHNEISLDEEVSTHRSRPVTFFPVDFPDSSCTFTHLRF